MSIKKWISTVTTIAFITSLFFTSMAFADSPKNEKAKKSLVALGDSITYGYNLDNNHHPSKKAFPQLIAEHENLRVTNLSESGWTTADLLHALNTPRYKEAVKKADYITLNIGSNEFLQIAKEYLQTLDPATINQQELIAAYAQLNQNLPKVMEEIQKLTSAPVVIYTFYNPAPQELAEARAFIDLILEKNTPLGLVPPNQLIRLLASNPYDQFILADAHVSFGGSEISHLIRLKDNDIHPTTEGQELLAELAIKALQ